MAGMTRTEAVEYLTQLYSDLETLTGVTATDTDAGYKQVINDALLKLPVSYDNAIDSTYTVTASIVPYRALLRYYAVTKYKQKLSPDESYGITGEGVNIKRSVAFAQVNMLLQDLILELAALGYIMQVGRDVKGAITSFDYDTDAYEPESRSDRI